VLQILSGSGHCQRRRFLPNSFASIALGSRALLCKSALFAMLFANRPVDERSEAISNPVSTE
jgi:hypothetical protein